MGLFEKIKNALFEEEYVEIEEKPKKVKKLPSKKEVEKPIAKKVVLPEKRETRIEELEEEEVLEDNFDALPDVEPQEKEEFIIMNDDDFKVEEAVSHRSSEPQIVKVIDKDAPVREEQRYYQGKKEKQPYGIDESNRVSVPEYGRNSYDTVTHGAYERKEDRTHFKPSPIISPIYGIFDKNYKKEDVVTKKEVRLVSSYARENLSVDDVRKKAYGSLSDDIAKSLEETPVNETPFVVTEVEEESNLLVDLSSESGKPAVKEVTMGDALEYFEDLGLEYNVDYVDANKEKSVGHRVKDEHDEDAPKIIETKIETKIEHTEVTQVKDTAKDNVEIDSDDNLFDLIDSMYKEND